MKNTLVVMSSNREVEKQTRNTLQNLASQGAMLLMETGSADVAFARACGFGAKLCIHPRQVEAVRRLFAPTPDEIDWAARVVTAANTHAGAFALDGKMVDRPVLLKAQAILGRRTN